MQISFHRFDTNLGEMAITWDESGVLSVQLPEANAKALKSKIQARFPQSLLLEPAKVPKAISALQKKICVHLAGEKQRFTLQELALDRLPAFHRKVYAVAQKIPAGSVLTYGELAKQSGSPQAFRAVGQAMAKNPFPIIVPCHRVVAAGKKSGGFTAFGGVATKAKILAVEAPGLSWWRFAG